MTRTGTKNLFTGSLYYIENQQIKKLIVNKLNDSCRFQISNQLLTYDLVI
jgi:hypothetical protein